MKLLGSDIKQYQRLYKKYFDEEVKEKDARKQLTRLVRQVEIVHQPITIAQFDNFLKRYLVKGQNDG